MKVAWRQILQKWKKTDGRSLSCVTKGCFPRMLKLLMDQININSENNIRAEFRKTGISPLNPNEVLARLPEEAQSDEEAKEAIDKSVLNLLKEMPHGSINIKEHKNEGRSVSHEDVESYADTDTEPEIKKKRIQKINNTKSAKAHRSTAFETIITETNNLPASDNDQLQRSDWRDIEVEKLPIVLTEDLQLYEEIVNTLVRTYRFERNKCERRNKDRN
ncbi:unnamed protein product [Parnassius apollo]|uniref:(apollo) hypothetical protein n=1 Tax=Parnassius apollo TaxID=110799 RepID=A0A8S3WQ24_PARAO|nr:unnamed protein product [Parnassius apollo]